MHRDGNCFRRHRFGAAGTGSGTTGSGAGATGLAVGAAGSGSVIHCAAVWVRIRAIAQCMAFRAVRLPGS